MLKSVTGGRKAQNIGMVALRLHFSGHKQDDRRCHALAFGSCMILCIPLSLHISVCQVEGGVCLLILCCAMLTYVTDGRERKLYAAVCIACSYFGKTTAAFSLWKKNILVFKLYLQKYLSYGKDLYPFTHVCKVLF